MLIFVPITINLNSTQLTGMITVNLFIYYYLFIKYINPRKPLRARIPTDMERDKRKKNVYI